MKNLRIGTCLAALLITAIGVSPAFAAWPDKSLTMVAAFPPGGTTDIMARLVAQHLQNELGQTVIVQNKPGAGGTVGAASVARSAPDGYTLMLGNVGYTAASMLFPDLTFDYDKDFTHISTVAEVPNVLLVSKSSPLNSVQDLLAAIRKNPGEINYGSAGVGTPHHLNAELFLKQAGVKATHVPYKGATPMMTDLVSGRVTFTIDTAGSALSQIRAGAVKPLAVTTAKRSPVLPDVPTMAESALPDFVTTTWYSVDAPKGLPADVRDRIYQAMLVMLKNPEMQKTLEGMAAQPGGMPPEAFARFVTEESKNWNSVAKDLAASKQ
jgi:tripartite-type tricarboxylate transporter receptor subunit TctC